MSTFNFASSRSRSRAPSSPRRACITIPTSTRLAADSIRSDVEARTWARNQGRRLHEWNLNGAFRLSERSLGNYSFRFNFRFDGRSLFLVTYKIVVGDEKP